MEKKSAEAVENLTKQESPQTYAELAKVTLAQITIFNRRRAGEVSKMTLASFLKRDQTGLHEDIAVGLSAFEQMLVEHFSRVEIMSERGRRVAVLLNPEVVSAAALIADKRDACNVDRFYWQWRTDLLQDSKENPLMSLRSKVSANLLLRLLF